MLSFIKKLYGSKPAEVAAPYKVEIPSFPAPTAEAKPAKKTAAKKAPAKPRKPKASKA
jgi:hypothetical protein